MNYYTCYRCHAEGKSFSGLPNGWSKGDLVGVYCPNCSAALANQKEVKEAEWEAKNQAKVAARKAKKQAAKEAQKAYDATPEGKKERNIASLSALAAILLFFLFAGVFHLFGVAFIVGFIAGAPFFWFRARKAGFIILVVILFALTVKFDKPDSADDGNSNVSKTTEVVAPAKTQTTSE